MKSELQQQFPGLAVANTKAVSLDESFRDHKETGSAAPPPPPSASAARSVGETGRRAVSNLPSWMTDADANIGGGADDASSAANTSADASKSRWGKRKHSDMTPSSSSEPALHQILQGTVTKLMDFGCFVNLSSDPNNTDKSKEVRMDKNEDIVASRAFMNCKQAMQANHASIAQFLLTNATPFTNSLCSSQGLVHISQLAKQMVNKPDEVVRKNQRVWVKVISVAGSRMSLSMKEVDQKTGKDLFPARQNAASMEAAPSNASMRTSGLNRGMDLEKFKEKQQEDEQKGNFRAKKQLTEQELFEAQQLIRSGVLPVDQYPTFDPEVGMLNVEETEEQTEVDLAEVEPPFLRGQTRRSGRDGGDPIKIIKNPDGSLQRAAMQQSTLAKERRELKQAQANNLIDSIPKDLNRPWEDPMPEAGERHFAAELRSINMSMNDKAPAWKEKAEGKTLSYGIINNKVRRGARRSRTQRLNKSNSLTPSSFGIRHSLRVLPRALPSHSPSPSNALVCPSPSSSPSSSAPSTTIRSWSSSERREAERPRR